VLVVVLTERFHYLASSGGGHLPSIVLVLAIINDVLLLHAPWNENTTISSKSCFIERHHLIICKRHVEAKHFTQGLRKKHCQ